MLLLKRTFWAKVVNIVCYVTNKYMIKLILNKTPYELLNNRKLKLIYLRDFGCKCFVLNNRKHDLGKFVSKSDKIAFVGYSSTIIYNKRTICVEENVYASLMNLKT